MASDLANKISSDLIPALRAKDALTAETLRSLMAAIHNREIEKKTKTGKSDLSEEEVSEVVGREAKKRREAADLYEKGSRKDLADKELAELKIIKRYLPEELSEAEVVKIVEETIAALRPEGAKDFGRVMGEAMKKLKGRAEAGLVSRLMKEKLEKLGDS